MTAPLSAPRVSHAGGNCQTPHRHQRAIMAEPEMSPATRLDDLAALGPLTRREAASALR